MKTMAWLSAICICAVWVVPAMIAGRFGVALMGWTAALSFACAILLTAPARGAFDPVDRPGIEGGDSGGWYRPPGALSRRRGIGGGRVLAILSLLGIAMACAGGMLYAVVGPRAFEG